MHLEKSLKLFLEMIFTGIYIYKYLEINDIQMYFSLLLPTLNVSLQLGKCTPRGTCTPGCKLLVSLLFFAAPPAQIHVLLCIFQDSALLSCEDQWFSPPCDDRRLFCLQKQRWEKAVCEYLTLRRESCECLSEKVLFSVQAFVKIKARGQNFGVAISSEGFSGFENIDFRCLNQYTTFFSFQT